MYPVFSTIFLERSQVTRDSFDTGMGQKWVQQSTTHIIGIILQKGYVCQFTVAYFCHYVHSKGAQSTMKCWILNVKHVISCSSPALSSESVFPLLFFFFFVRKQAAPLCCLYQRFSGTTNGAATRAARPSTRPTGKLWIGWSCSAGFLTTRQPVMQHWRLEFSRCCCFTSGQGRIDLRFRRSMLSEQVLRGSSHECQQGSKGSQWPYSAGSWVTHRYLCNSQQQIIVAVLKPHAGSITSNDTGWLWYPSRGK